MTDSPNGQTHYADDATLEYIRKLELENNHLAQMIVNNDKMYAKNRAELLAVIEQMRAVVDAAKGLVSGIDWNAGTYSKIYRPKLISALKALALTPDLSALKKLRKP